MYVVKYNWLPVTWCLGKADIPRYNRTKNLCAKETAQIGCNLLGESGPVVVHGEKDALYRKCWVDGPAQAHQCVEQLGDALKG